ncbi:MAG: cytochrome c-type biogenesis protein CcmH [Pseudorhodoplanes sp.]
MRSLRILLLAVVVFGVMPCRAMQPDEMLADPLLESRARILSKELRCMVCQNQSIDDSDAPLARDLRVLVRERLKAGDSDEQVLKFLVQRYGDFVLLDPPFNRRTLLLWGAPAGLLLIGLLVIAMAARRRPTPPAANLTTSEEKRLAMLENDDRNRQ